MIQHDTECSQAMEVPEFGPLTPHEFRWLVPWDASDLKSKILARKDEGFPE